MGSISDNIKMTARVPIIADDINNRARHKDKEIVFDFEEEDLYIKRDGQYINITGKIRDTVSEIQDGSTVIHVVTEESLPAIKDRPKNHWYFIITKSEEYQGGESVDTSSYIYYGVINDEYYKDKSYLLIAQNMIVNPSSVKMKIIEGYKACFYIPTSYEPAFYNDETGERLAFTMQDRLYCLTPDGTSISYDVYISDESNLGDIYIDVTFTGTDWYTIDIVSNDIQIPGLELPVDLIKVEDGNVIGEIPDPIWTAPRYVFKGWSTKKVQFEPIDPMTYIPTGNIKIFAYFDYDNDDSKYTYKSIYVCQETSKTLGNFYGVEPPDTDIVPKAFSGYINTDSAVKLIRDGQTISFENYRPISYNITYDLDDGILNNPKTTYTVEEGYSPPIPYREGYSFQRWNPRRINVGSTGDVVFTAIWEANSVIRSGSALRTELIKLYSGIETHATSIMRSTSEPNPNNNAVDVSIEGSPIYIWYSPDEYAIKYYSEYDITCNADMSGAFEGFNKLRDISPLIQWEVYPDTVITNMFKGCTSLSDLAPLSSWNLSGGNFKDAFKNTAAEVAGRLPNWYIWKCTVRYVSNHIISGVHTDKILRSEQYSKTPGSSFVPTPSSAINHYTLPTSSVILTDKDQIFEVRCEPVYWEIVYDLDGGEWGSSVQQNKILYQYAFEDISETPYIPPQDLVKEGATFVGWRPSSMPIGTTGVFTFTAIWS